MKNDISIIVPIYKVPESYLIKCIDSIINQSKKNIEIILVDDESPDNCPLICDEYKKRDSRIKVIHQKNKGLSGARNAGVINATSKWITFVDGDDWLEEECLEQSYKFAETNDVDVLLWATVKDFNGKLQQYNYNKYLIDKKIYENEEIDYIRELLLHYNAQIAAAYSKLIKREILINENIYHDEELRQGAEGLEFNFRLFKKIKKAMFLNKNWYHYIYNKNSISSLSTIENTKCVIKCMKKIKTLINDDECNLNKWFNNRLKYVIVTTFISCIFHPNNNYIKAKRNDFAKEFMNIDIIKSAIIDKRMDEINFQRKMILFFIEHRWYFIVNILAELRFKQKEDNK